MYLPLYYVMYMSVYLISICVFLLFILNQICQHWPYAKRASYLFLSPQATIFLITSL